MNLHAFELGRLKDLSLAELSSVFGHEQIKKIIYDYALVDIPGKATTFQDRLGGTIKIGKIIGYIETKDLKLPMDFQKEIENFIDKLLEEQAENEMDDEQGKFLFAISLYGLPGNPRIFLKNVLSFAKRKLKSLKKSSRFVNKPWENITPAQVFKAKVLDKGMDLTFLHDKQLRKIYISKTETIQNIDAYSQRDYDKPFRDMKMGMLPPKLSQIMLNLANTGKESTTSTIKTVYDPFCGSGTILMEALLQNKAVVGSDINPQAVEGTKKNLNWLTETTEQEDKIFELDATTLTTKNFPKDVDAVVTEGYLGPIQTTFPDERTQNKIFSELERLHIQWLKSVPKDTPVVLTIPAFRTIHGKYNRFIQFPKLAKTLGFQITNQSSNEGPLIYDRKDQFVAREIVVMKKI